MSVHSENVLGIEAEGGTRRRQRRAFVAQIFCRFIIQFQKIQFNGVLNVNKNAECLLLGQTSK